jgi:hypothetical protein
MLQAILELIRPFPPDADAIAAQQATRRNKLTHL